MCTCGCNPDSHASTATATPTFTPGASSTVNEVLARHPGTVGIFHAFHIDTCCGGVATLGDVAHRAGMPLDVFVDALAIRARDAEATR